MIARSGGLGPSPRGAPQGTTLPSDRDQQPRSIVIVTDNFGGGTGQHLRDMLAYRDLTAWPTRILCYGIDDGLEPPRGVPYRRRRYRSKLVRFPIPQLRVLWDLRRELKRVEPILHTYFFWPIMYGRILKKIGLVRVLVENREDLGFKYGRLHRWALRRLQDQPDLIICVSTAVQQATVANEDLPVDKTVVIENGVSLPEAVGQRRFEARRRLRLEADQVAIALVANLNRPVKAVDRFIESIPLIRAECPNARFFIAGDGYLRKDLEAHARRLRVDDVLRFLGRVTDMDSVYSALDISVLTSKSEGLSITVLESMAHRLPVVVTSVGGNSEVVLHGETGLLVPLGDVRMFADAVVQLCREPETRARMGTAARVRCETRYDVRSVSRRYEASYEALLPRTTPGRPRPTAPDALA